MLCLLDICAGQTEEDASPEDRRLHKHKKKRRPYQQPYGAPCYDSGFLRDNGEGDQRYGSIFLNILSVIFQVEDIFGGFMLDMAPKSEVQPRLARKSV